MTDRSETIAAEADVSAIEEPAVAVRDHNRKKKKGKWTLQSVFALVLALLPLIGFVIFSGFTLVISFIAMFFNINIYDLTDPFVWNNFRAFWLVFDPNYYPNDFAINVSGYFYKSLGITFWIACAQLISLTIAIGISWLLSKKWRGSNVFMVLFFVPYICSGVAVSLMWRWVFNGNFGFINAIFGTEIDWLNEPMAVPWIIILAIVWQAPGYGIVMYRAAFAAVDPALYEAASLDGANEWQKFRYITLPSISPTTFYLLIAGVGAGLLTYDMAALIAPQGWGDNIGGPENMGLTLMRLVYWLIGDSVVRTEDAFASCASVISWVLFLFTGVASMILFRIRDRRMKDVY